MSLSYIEINKKYLKDNIDTLLRIAQDKTVGFVVKAHAYGHGIKNIIPELQKNLPQKHYVCVISIEEACQVRQCGWTGKILVIGHIPPENILDAYALNLEVTIYSYEYLQSIIPFLDKKKTLNVHLKIDTGMHRLGIELNEITSVLYELKKHPSLSLVGVYSHYFDSCSSSKKNILSQNNLFEKCIQEIKKHYPHICVHIDSSGTFHTKSINNTMMRVGSLLYGFYKSDTHKQKLNTIYPWANFKQILTWKAPIIDIKNISNYKNGVGYAPRFTHYQPQKIAIVPIGYSDGYPQELAEHKTYVKTDKNEYASLCSLVSMNYITIDITHLKQIPNSVIITSEDPHISLESLGKKINKKPFSLTSIISPSLKRICV